MSTATLDNPEIMEADPEQDAPEPQPEPPAHQVGKLTLAGKETRITLRVDAVGFDDVGSSWRPLYLLSAAGTQSATKALHAVLAKGTTGNNVKLTVDLPGWNFPVTLNKWTE